MKKNDIYLYNIIKEIFDKKRWFVVLDNTYNGRKKMPRANYVWLKANPAFISIPKTYVIHHLDHDKTNDDPSNLVLMQKYLHTAHHWKYKKTYPKVDVEYSFIDTSKKDPLPASEPKVIYRKDRSTFGVSFLEGFGDQKTRRTVYNYNGVKLSTKELAEKAKHDIRSSLNAD